MTDPVYAGKKDDGSYARLAARMDKETVSYTETKIDHAVSNNTDTRVLSV